MALASICWYEVRVDGDSVLLDPGKGPAFMGFTAVRYVAATDPLDAKERALKLVRRQLGPYILNSADDPPRYRVAEPRGLDSLEGCMVPGKGFTFFHEEGGEAARAAVWALRLRPRWLVWVMRLLGL
jgi:hypothetical protein